jgi:multidrug efflux pump subunit AcrB
MSFAIMVSLLVSFTLTPMLSSRWLRPARAAGRTYEQAVAAWRVRHPLTGHDAE